MKTVNESSKIKDLDELSILELLYNYVYYVFNLLINIGNIETWK